MMNRTFFWWTIFLTFLVQEHIATNYVLTKAYQGDFGFCGITTLFFVGTFLGITIGYFAGEWFICSKLVRALTLRFPRFVKWAESARKNFTALAGSKGISLSLVLLGTINQPYINAVVGACCKVPFRQVLIFGFVGNLLWYGAQWMVVLGVTAVVADPGQAVVTVLGISLLALLLIRHYLNRQGL